MSSKDKKETIFQDSEEYLAKKAYFNKFITVYGKKAVLDLLSIHTDVQVERILVDKENKSENLRRIVQLAQKKNIPVKEIYRDQLTRISKNKDEDQGIVADVVGNIETDWKSSLDQSISGAFLALDGVTNPVNLGMIIRSAAAAGVEGLLIPEKGVPSINQPLVIKAASGTIFRMRIYRHPELADALKIAKDFGFKIIGLSDEPQAMNLFQAPPEKKAIYVLGNESVGLSEEVRALCDGFCKIPMTNQVESLNVAAAATLVAYSIGKQNLRNV
jgi:23S rRNA (guanosine2251-2'-O)-methyltransferase